MIRYIVVFYRDENTPSSSDVYEFSTLKEIKHYLLNNEDGYTLCDVWSYETNELVKTYEVVEYRKIYEIKKEC